MEITVEVNQHLKKMYETFLDGRTLVKVSYDDMKKKYDTDQLCKNPDGSVTLEGFDDLEERLKNVCKENSKITKFALTLGMLSRPVLMGGIYRFISNAHEPSK
jgi:hypothetical protein